MPLPPRNRFPSRGCASWRVALPQVRSWGDAEVDVEVDWTSTNNECCGATPPPLSPSSPSPDDSTGRNRSASGGKGRGGDDASRRRRLPSSDGFRSSQLSFDDDEARCHGVVTQTLPRGFGVSPENVLELLGGAVVAWLNDSNTKTVCQPRGWRAFSRAQPRARH